MGKNKTKLLSKLKNTKLTQAIQQQASSTATTTTASSTSSSSKVDDDTDIMNDNNDDDDDFELDETEEEMLRKVEEKMLEKTSMEIQLKQQSDISLLSPDIDDIALQMEKDIENKKQELLQQQQQQQQNSNNNDMDNESKDENVTTTTTTTTTTTNTDAFTTTTTTTATTATTNIKKTTTGIGGTWEKNSTSEVETYRPANGGWGYFPRPKDISRAYGGGKRIERTSTLEDEQRKLNSVNDTREKLKAYREKVGIEVQSEKDHSDDIEEALRIGQLAMQRGVYNTAVSALEKVTKYCSTNSKVGGKVFLELAMAYEAVGRTSEAIQVYSTLSNSRMEDIKFNAKRLLYGIESMKFMRDEVKSEAFSRQRVKQTFIDTTGLANIAQNFDDSKVYNTAYIDLDRGGGFYRKLTESVVRSIREARQILLAATDSGEVDRLKIVQALRSIERKFNEALAEEKKRNTPKEEPVAIMNGKPIVKQEDIESATAIGMDTFNLGDMEQTLENVDGEWKLQLIADSKGDGVKFYNKTLSWQYFDTKEMKYDAYGPAGFLTISKSGKFSIDESSRIISWKQIETSGSGALWKGILGDSNNVEQQIMSVDSEILITRTVMEKKALSDTVKDYFSVWRRAKTGLYSGK